MLLATLSPYNILYNILCCEKYQLIHKKLSCQFHPYLEKIVSAPELQGDCPETNPYAALDGSGLNVALLFKNHPDKLTIENPLPFYQYPIQAKGLEVVVNCEARTAGANIYYPLSALIAVGI